MLFNLTMKNTINLTINLKSNQGFVELGLINSSYVERVNLEHRFIN